MMTKPTTGNKSTDPKFSQAKFLPAVFLISVLILSTSFQSGHYEMHKLESEFLLPDLAKNLKEALNNSNTGSILYAAEEQISLKQYVTQFYLLTDFRPAWTSYNRLNAHGLQMKELIDHARCYGLEPENYHVSKIQVLCGRLDEKLSHSEQRKLRKDIDLLMTDAALAFMVNLHAGYLRYDSLLMREAWMGALPGILFKGIRDNSLESNILSVQPGFIAYTRLQHATANYVKNYRLTNDSLNLEVAGADSAIFYDRLGQALANLGYTRKNCSRRDLHAGLKDFQAHHGLESDGLPGKNTVEALQITTLYRYKMLALNLDRLRKQNNDESHLLYVNIPAYQLTVYRQNKIEDIYRVIVGNPQTPTPQFISKIKRIIANPVWDVPLSIAQKELLPKIKADSGYLNRNGFKLVDRNNRTVNLADIDINKICNSEYFIRQQSSSDNALGKVKFIFPNDYSVYLHDTPSRTLFSKDTRDLSHGCIRLQNPEKLAEYLVHVIECDSTDISGLIARGVRREFELQTEIPIHISYITCNADEDGALYFYRDIYRLDEKELADMAVYSGI